MINYLAKITAQIVLGFAFGIGLYAAFWVLAAIGAIPLGG